MSSGLHPPSDPVQVSEAYRIAIFDINFRSQPDFEKLAGLSGVAQQCEEAALSDRADRSDDPEILKLGVEGLWTAYTKSYDWLFYGVRHGSHEASIRSEPRDRRLPETLPPLRRFIMRGSDVPSATLVLRDGKLQLPVTDYGWSLLFEPRHLVGVASFWFHVGWPGCCGTLPEALAFKNLKILEFSHVVRRLEVFASVREQERQHTLLAIRLASRDTPQSAIDRDGAGLGRLITGSGEYTDDDWLRTYVDRTQSTTRRSYERMFVRWTDTLLIYNQEVDKADMKSYRDELQKSIARSAQVIELCVLLRRLLRNMSRELETRSSRHVLLPWLMRRNLLRPFFAIEQTYRIAPPFRTVEGEQIVTATFTRFGIDELFESTRRAAELLERRLEAIQTELGLALATAAIVASVLVELKPW